MRGIDRASDPSGALLSAGARLARMELQLGENAAARSAVGAGPRPHDEGKIEVYQSLPGIRPERSPRHMRRAGHSRIFQARARSLALTIGNFDGVHRGHQAMLSRLGEAAEDLELPPRC